jgi:hypothetical protein
MAVAKHQPERDLEIVARALHTESRRLSAAGPIQVFSAGLEDVRSPEFPRNIRRVGLRYLIEEDASMMPIAAVDVRGPPEQAYVGAIIRGQMATLLTDALNTAERIARDEAKGYEFRILEVPALYVTALWLHGEAPARDLYIPLAAGAVDPEFIQHVISAANEWHAMSNRRQKKSS